MTKLIVNVETGETVERELNKSEKDQQKADEIIDAEMQTVLSQKAADRAALLAQLGITEEQAKLLLG
jgi:hypothetical protein